MGNQYKILNADTKIGVLRERTTNCMSEADVIEVVSWSSRV